MHLRFVPLLLLMLLASSSSQALELVLKNGDRLHGTLVKETETHLVIAHPQLGEIEIAKSALQVLPPSLQTTSPKTDAPSEADQEAAPASPSPSQSPPTDKPPSPVEEGKKKTATGKGDSHDLAPFLPEELIRRLVKMNANVGLSFNVKESSKDRSDLRFFFNSQWENGESDFRFDTDYQFGQINDEVSDDRFLADFRFRRHRERDLFLQTRTRYKTDEIRKINHYLEQDVGLGWNRRLSPRFEYHVGPQMVALFRDLDESNGNLGGWSYLGSVFQDSEFQINEYYQLDQEARVYLAPEDTDNWGYTLELNLTGKMSNGLSLRLGYEFSYDNQVAQKVPQEETSFFSSVMYSF